MVNNKDVFVNVSTGFGKSLVYQIACYFFKLVWLLRIHILQSNTHPSKENYDMHRQNGKSDPGKSRTGLENPFLTRNFANNL